METQQESGKPYPPTSIYGLLCGILKNADQAGSTNKYTKNSLRATATSRMFVKNVPVKIIAEKMGHRSLPGLHAYEHTTLDQEQRAWALLMLLFVYLMKIILLKASLNLTYVTKRNHPILQCLLVKWKTVFSTSIN